MSVLVIETSGHLVGVALAADDGTITVRCEQGARRHNEVLAPLLFELIGDQASRTALRAVAVDVGPGLFTGLRVGIATAQALAFGLDVDAIALTATEMAAHGAFNLGVRGNFAAVIDARRDEVYVEHFVLADGGVLATGHGPIVASRTTASDAIAGGAHVGGSGAGIIAEGRTDIEVVFDLDVEALRAGATLGRARAGRGETLRPAELRALYLRDADARINFETRTSPDT